MERILADTVATLRETNERLHAALVADGHGKKTWGHCDCAACRAGESIIDAIWLLDLGEEAGRVYEPVGTAAAGYEWDLGGEG